MINQKKLALLMGILLGGLHLLWSLAVAIIPTTLQNCLNWCFGLHFLQPYLVVTPFDFWKMVLLVVVTFIIGLILGRVIGLILNHVMTTTKKK